MPNNGIISRQAFVSFDIVLNGSTYEVVKNQNSITFKVVDNALLEGNGSVIELRIYNLDI